MRIKWVIGNGQLEKLKCLLGGRPNTKLARSSNDCYFHPLIDTKLNRIYISITTELYIKSKLNFGLPIISGFLLRDHDI